jgi:HSP20 family protein
MAIQKWDPVRDLVNLQEKMNDMFDDALARSVDPEGADPMTAAGWRPPIDLFEEANRYVLRADLPGVSAADVEIQVENGTLHLRGERKVDANVSRDAFLRVERPYGKFAVQIALPPSVEQQSIQARHRNGVIEVLLPKKKAEAPSRIEISAR